jgi:hypothetical protein
MRLKLLTALFAGALAVSAIPVAGFSGAALASDGHPTYGECASPPPNPKACERVY